MSIEKLDFQTITKEESSFTTFSNEEIQKFDDLEALGVWAYIQSLNTSIVSFKQIAEHFNLSIEKTLSILRKIYPGQGVASNE
jgi:hypothetical protein